MSLLLARFVQSQDTATVSLALTPSADETAQFVDTATEAFALTPSDSQVFDGADTSIEYLFLDPLDGGREDDFNDNSLDPKYWRIIGSGDIREANQQIEFWGSVAGNLGTDRTANGHLTDIQIKVVDYPTSTGSVIFDWTGQATVPTIIGGFQSIAGFNFQLSFSAGTTTLNWKYRNDSNVTVSSGSVTSLTPPTWLRIKKDNPGFSMQYSTDGSSWTTLMSTATEYKWMRRVYSQFSVLSGVAATRNAVIDNYYKAAEQVIDTAQFVDTQTTVLALTPSATEEYGHTDAATETFALTPSDSQIFAGVDSNTENLSLTPSTPSQPFGAWDSPPAIVTVANQTLTALSQANSVREYGQTFVANSGSIREAALYLLQVGSPSDSITLEIWSDSAGQPGTLLGSATRLGSSMPTGAIANFTAFAFSSGIPTTLGSTYWIVFYRTGATDGTNFYRFSQAFPLYSDGDLYRSDNGAAFSTASVPGQDMAFGIYYQSQPTDLVLALTPSASETAQFVDAATEALALTPSSTDTAQYVDAVTERLALTPSGSQVFAGVDSNTEYLYLTATQSSFEDWFDDGVIDPRFKATGSSQVLEQNGRIEFFKGATSSVILEYNFSGIQIGAGLSSAPSEVKIQILSFDNGANNNIVFTLQNSSSQFAQIGYTENTLTGFITNDAGGSAAFAQATGISGALWLRIRRTFPGLVAEYSTNGTSWTAICSTASDFKWMNRTGLVIEAVDNSKTTGQLLSAIDNFSWITPDVVDTAQFVESQTTRLSLTPSSTDTAQFVDAATEIFVLTPSGTDVYTAGSVDYIDSDTEYLALVPSSSDVADFVDSNTEALALVPSSTDAAQFSDSNSETLSLVPSSSDTFAGVDAATEIFTLEPSATSVASYVDSGTEGLLLSPSSLDSLSAVDANTEVFNLSPTSTDTGHFIDSATESLLLIPSADESQSGATSDANTENFALTPSAAESQGFLYSDSDTELFSLRPSSDDSGSFVDTSTEYLQLAPSSDDFKVIFDSGTETLSLVPSSTDIGELTDVLTAILTLTPTADDLFSAGKIDEGTLYLHLTPTQIEVLRFIKLVGRLLSHYSGYLAVRYDTSNALQRYSAEPDAVYDGRLRRRF